MSDIPKSNYQDYGVTHPVAEIKKTRKTTERFTCVVSYTLSRAQIWVEAATVLWEIASCLVFSTIVEDK